jgi:hypothetical protein
MKLYWSYIFGFRDDIDSKKEVPPWVRNVGFKYHLSLPDSDKYAGLMNLVLGSYILDHAKKTGDLVRMKNITNKERWDELNNSWQKGKAITIYPKDLI